jgi:hypothetical protein
MSQAVIVQLLQLGGSIIAILLLWLLAVRLGLGGDVRIRDADHARQLAEDALDGFAPIEIAIDRAGVAALLRDAAGRVMLVRRHGAQFAARLLDNHSFARLDRNFLTVANGEKRFGAFTLDLGENAQVWASSLRRLGA